MKTTSTGRIASVALLLFVMILSILLVNGTLTSVRAQRIVAVTGLTLLIIGSFIMLWDKDALRDSSTQKGNDKPYSFSRVQLWWWTLIIMGCWLGVYATRGIYWEMNSTCLVLLGISVGTTVSGRMVDSRQTNTEGNTRHQDEKSEGLITDILSDENGLSIHRFQTLVFNVAYGLSFIVTVFSDLDAGKFPEYKDTVLALLGMSSGAYLVMKMSENKTNGSTGSTGNTNTSAGAAGNDELLDANTGTADDH